MLLERLVSTIKVNDTVYNRIVHSGEGGGARWCNCLHVPHYPEVKGYFTDFLESVVSKMLEIAFHNFQLSSPFLPDVQSYLRPCPGGGWVGGGSCIKKAVEP